MALLVLVAGVCLSGQSAQAAEHCPVRVEGVEEDQTLADTRPLWTGSRFAVTLLAHDTFPTDIQLRAYVLGGAYSGTGQRLRWLPTGVASIYRSLPIVLAFPQDETFLQVGVTALNDPQGFHDCVLRLHPVLQRSPLLSLQPLAAAPAVSMQPIVKPAARKRDACNMPVRIAQGAPNNFQVPSDAPTRGGPFVTLMKMQISPTGHVLHSSVEASSGLGWLDEQVAASALRQSYAPAQRACQSVAGRYYFSGTFDTPQESDPTAAF